MASPFLHEAQLANAVTGFATCLAGIMPLLFTRLTHPQPARWMLVYWCILITGIPTVWFHAFEDSRIASAFDVGTNILLAYAIVVAVCGDFMSTRTRLPLLFVVTILDALAIGWIVHEINVPVKYKLLTFGSFGHFHVGEVALILNSLLSTLLFAFFFAMIPRHARGLLVLTWCVFLLGAVLASASNSQVDLRIFAWHATWHIVGAFGLVTLWLFNHTRFTTQAHAVRPLPQAAQV